MRGVWSVKRGATPYGKSLIIGQCWFVSVPTGTFGEKLHWHLTYPICPSLLPHKTLPGMNRAASFHTMQIVGGPMISKWK